MSARTIETRAVISAEDRTGPAFAAVVQHMARMEDAARKARLKIGEMNADKYLAGGGAHGRVAQINAERAATHRALVEDRALRREELAHLREVNRLHKEIEHHGVGRYLAQGAANAVAAHSMVETISKTIEAGAERQHVKVGMQNAGMKPDEIGRMEGVATEASKGAPNMSISEIMELGKEARSSVQHTEEAFELLPMLAKAASVLKGMGADNANVAEVVKAGESLGLMNDPKRFRAYLDGQVRAMNVMGKTITTEQIYEAAKYSKAAGSTLSDRFLNTVMPSLIQEMHGSSAGDALSMMSKTLRGGLQHKHLPVERLNELGMLEDPSKIKRSKTGEIMGYKGRIVGEGLMASDPDKFAEILDKHMEDHGIKTLADKVKTLYETLPSTAANLMRILIQQKETLKQHGNLYDTSPGLDQAAINQLKDATVAIGNLSKSFNDLGASVTGPAMATVGTVLSSIAAGVRSLGEAAKNHPIAAMTGGTALAGGALAGSGYMAYRLLNGFGLSTSAAALDGSAAALTAAAARLGVAGGVHTAEDLGGVAKGLGGGAAVAGGIAIAVPLIGAGLATAPLIFARDPSKALGGSKAGTYNAGNELPGFNEGLENQDRTAPKRNPYGGLTRNPYGGLAPMSRAGSISGSFAPVGYLDHDRPTLARGEPTQKVGVSFDQPPPQKIDVTVTSSSALLQIVDSLKELKVQLKAKADIGPGGLGETHTGQ